jgi:hypothetical protein
MSRKSGTTVGLPGDYTFDGKPVFAFYSMNMSKYSIDKRFNRLEPLLKWVGSSFVIQEQYK